MYLDSYKTSQLLFLTSTNFKTAGHLVRSPLRVATVLCLWKLDHWSQTGGESIGSRAFWQHRMRVHFLTSGPWDEGMPLLKYHTGGWAQWVMAQVGEILKIHPQILKFWALILAPVYREHKPNEQEVNLDVEAMDQWLWHNVDYGGRAMIDDQRERWTWNKWKDGSTTPLHIINLLVARYGVWWDVSEHTHTVV